VEFELKPEAIGIRLLRVLKNEPDPQLMEEINSIETKHEELINLFDASQFELRSLSEAYQAVEAEIAKLKEELEVKIRSNNLLSMKLSSSEEQINAQQIEYQRVSSAFQSIHADLLRIKEIILLDNPQYKQLGNELIDLSIVEMSMLNSVWITPEDNLDARTNTPDLVKRVTRPSRTVAIHPGFRQNLSSGSKERKLPRSFSNDESFDTAEQAFTIVNNGVVFPAMGCVMFSPGKLIEETVFVASQFKVDLTHVPGISVRNGAIVFDPSIAAKTQHIRTPCLVSVHGSSLAYGHWISDTITSVFLWRDALLKGKISLLMPYQRVPWTEQILDAFDIPKSARIQPETNVLSLETCIVSVSCSTQNVLRPPDVLVEIADFILEKIEAKRSNPGHKLLYISRDDQTTYWKRTIVNEDELLEALKPLGFEIVKPGQMPFLAQAKLFSEAKIIVAPHGSALMNSIFAPRGCTVIDLMWDTWIDRTEHTWIHRLTNIMNQSYVVLLGKVTWLDNLSADGDIDRNLLGKEFQYRIDVSKTLHAVKAILGF
jgi:capsular polysaccharide biosynthesis protein